MADTHDEGAPDPGPEVPPLNAAKAVKATKASKSARKGPRTLNPAADRPVARVAVDIPLAHLDRPFDYLVPERLAAQALPGVRVRVRFAGQLTDGYILGRASASEHQGRLSYLERVVSPEQVLTPEIAGLARAVADRYAGTLADMLRLAIPQRHAATEAGKARGKGDPAPSAAQSSQPESSPGQEPVAAEARAAQGSQGDPSPGLDPVAGEALAAQGSQRESSPGREPGAREAHAAQGSQPEASSDRKPVAGEVRAAREGRREPPPSPEPGPWQRYPAGRAFLDALRDRRPARAAWTALPGATWPDEIARAAVTCASAGRGVVIVVPDARDLARVDEALRQLGGCHVTLTADLGPAERYRRWLAALRGEALIVAGTRAAMFAPVRDLGLVVLWDDGDDLHAEPRAPYPHARDVLALRAHRAGAAALIGGFARTAELAQLVTSGWARPLEPDRVTLRATAPMVRPAADDAELARDEAAKIARLPSLALRTARAALATGPVLVQVPRRGYLAAIACGRCRAQARCARCNGALELASQHATPECRWCGAKAASWSCPRCGHDKIRAIVTGAARTAEELGRAFPAVTVRTSGGDKVIPRISDEPGLVIATPGAEPLGRYAAALLLDGWALLGRPSLRAGEEALRRWLAAAAMVRSDGKVLVHADAALPAVQALIRWDPAGFAERELADRAELAFPPAVRMAAVTGEPEAVASLLRGVPEGFEVLGPVPADRAAGHAETDAVRALVRAPRDRGAALAGALHAAQAARSARKEGGMVRVQLDPAEVI